MPQKQPPAKTAVSSAAGRSGTAKAGRPELGARASERPAAVKASTPARISERIGLPQVSACKLFKAVVSCTLRLPQEFPDLRPQARFTPTIARCLLGRFGFPGARGLEQRPRRSTIVRGVIPVGKVVVTPRETTGVLVDKRSGHQFACSGCRHQVPSPLLGLLSGGTDELRNS